MMVDLKKRTTLKTISGAAAIVATPAIAAAGSGHCLLGNTPTAQRAKEVIVPINNGAELSIALSVDAEPTIRLTNHGNQVLIVKHVYPGIIHAGTQRFDINSIFENNAFRISAGQSHTVRIQPMTDKQSETDFPREHYRNHPQRIVAVTGKDQIGDIVNSTRSFFT